jgi:tight adherence protein B
VLLFEGGYLLWSSYRSADARRLQGRLRQIATAGHGVGDVGLIKQRRLSQSPALAQALLRIPRVEVFDRMLVQSGLQRTVAGWLGLTLVGALVGSMVWALTGAPGWALLVCIAGAAALPTLQVLRARRKRLRTIEQQLPDALDLMSRALRAGQAFAGAMQMVGEEAPEPIAGEFRAAFDEVNYGVQTQQALRNLALRVPVADLRFFVIAVAIQRETGGNLTELLDTLSSLVRARFKLLATIRVLSAEGRLSAWILSALPFVLLGLVNFINPRFMSILWTDPFGLAAVWGGAGFIVVGLLWMWRITRIRV